MKQDKINLKRMEVILINVEYKYSDLSNGSKIDVVDKVTKNDVSLMEYFSLIFERNISFIPNNSKFISVTYLIKCYLDDHSISFFGNDSEKLNDWIDRRKNEIVVASNAVINSSTLIANLTSNSTLFKPLILPPNIITKK